VSSRIHQRSDQLVFEYTYTHISASYTYIYIERERMKKMEPSSWDVDHVAEWIASIGLPNYITNFVHNDIDGDILVHLDMETMKEIGVEKKEDREKIAAEISEMINHHKIEIDESPFESLESHISNKNEIAQENALLRENIYINEEEEVLEAKREENVKVLRHEENEYEAILIENTKKRLRETENKHESRLREHEQINHVETREEYKSLMRVEEMRHEKHRNALLEETRREHENILREHENILQREIVQYDNVVLEIEHRESRAMIAAAGQHMKLMRKARIEFENKIRHEIARVERDVETRWRGEIKKTKRLAANEINLLSRKLEEVREKNKKAVVATSLPPPLPPPPPPPPPPPMPLLSKIDLTLKAFENQFYK